MIRWKFDEWWIWFGKYAAWSYQDFNFSKFIAYNSQLYWCCNFARDRSNLWNLAKNEKSYVMDLSTRTHSILIRRYSRLNSRRQFSNVERDTFSATDRLQEVDSIRVFCVKYKHVHWRTKRHCSPRPRNAKWDIHTSKWIQAIQSCPYIWLGDPPFYVCQVLGALIRVSTCGSILGPFGVHFGSILGPFWWCIFRVLGFQLVFRQESVFRQEY